MALKARAAAVDETDLAKAFFVRGVDVFLDDGWNVSRLKAVEIDHVFDLDERSRLGVIGRVGRCHGERGAEMTGSVGWPS
jgi:hypothetical protein